MSRINIGGDKDDVFYRYKMDPIQSKIEGSGNGIKTVMPNLAEVGRALHRPPMYPCKYFGTELGAQTKYDSKNDRYIINGAHEASKLQELLTGFIDKFVLCGSCGNPETDIKIIKGLIERHCLACGQVTPIDMRHKITTYIVNHPPDGATVVGGKKKGKRGKARKSKEQTPQVSDHEGDNESGDELHKQILAEAKRLGQSQLQDDDWSVDMSESAKAKRQVELLKGVEKLALAEAKKSKSSKKDKKNSKKKNKSEGMDDEDEFDHDPLDVLATFVQSKPKASVLEIMSEIRDTGIPIHLASHVLAQVLVRVDTLAGDLKSRAVLFRKLNQGNSRSQKYFMGGLERLIGTIKEKSVTEKKVPVMLKVLYEMDIVEEQAIMSWGSKVTKKWTGSKEASQLVHDAARPFLEWLEESEGSEEEEDDEDENEDEEEDEDEDEE